MSTSILSGHCLTECALPLWAVDTKYSFLEIHTRGVRGAKSKRLDPSDSLRSGISLFGANETSLRKTMDGAKIRNSQEQPHPNHIAEARGHWKGLRVPSRNMITQLFLATPPAYRRSCASRVVRQPPKPQARMGPRLWSRRKD